MALGATSRAVVQLILGHGLKLAATGLVLGMTAAFALTRLLQSVLFEVSPFDPIAFGLVAVTLGAIGAIACWLPARRATRVDPIEALRTE
jgi:ABC-type antimicrobial peptide transport system permease subunit